MAFGGLSSWTYDPLYAEGWSVEIMFAMTIVVDASGDDNGDIENVIFANDGEVVGIIAEVCGFWDILDTRVHAPWNEVTLEGGIQRMRSPVTEETIDDYDVFAAYMTFPREHWTQIVSTNPRERVNREVKRRSDVIGIFPNDEAIIRLVGALMLEDQRRMGGRTALHEPRLSDILCSDVICQAIGKRSSNMMAS